MPTIKPLLIFRAWFLLLPLRIKWFFQRLFRGYSDPEWWDIDYYLAKWLLPRLRHLRRHTHGYPDGMSELEWGMILARMCLAFAIIEEYGGDRMDNPLLQKYIDEGLDLFRKHYFSLWD